jgi:hypothetical protein
MQSPAIILINAYCFAKMTCGKIKILLLTLRGRFPARTGGLMSVLLLSIPPLSAFSFPLVGSWKIRGKYM